MPNLVRTSLIIGERRIPDEEFNRISLSQRVGDHHSFQIRIQQDASRIAVEGAVQKWIGAKVSIGFDYESSDKLKSTPVTEVFRGVISSVNLSSNEESAEYILNGYSTSILTDDGKNTQSFTDMGLVQIVENVLEDFEENLSEYGDKSAINVQEHNAVIPYTVQYKESAFSFINRLANVYGEWFYYDGKKLVFGDPQEEEPILLDFKNQDLKSISLSAKTAPLNFALKAYDYTNNKVIDSPMVVRPYDGIAEKIVDKSVEMYDRVTMVPVNEFMVQDSLDQLAIRKDEIITDELVTLSGSSRNPNIRVGKKIKIFDKEDSELGVFFVTGLTHDISQKGDYFNHFEAVADTVRKPPLSTMPKAPYCEPQFAKVVDIDDDLALGRVKVKFIWQNDTSETSPFIRVMSPYAGKGRGFYMSPEIDDLVLVAFENNNADKPYITSSSYHIENNPVHYHQENYELSIITKALNMIIFNDNSQHIAINTQNEINLTANNKFNFNTSLEANSEFNLNVGAGIIVFGGKTYTFNVENKIDILSDNEVNINADVQVNLSSGGGFDIKAEKGKLSLIAKDIYIEGTNSVTIVGGTKTEISGGGGTANLSGGEVKLNA